MNIDVGKLTVEDTEILLRQCIHALPFEIVSHVLETTLTKEQKEDLGESWFNIDKN